MNQPVDIERLLSRFAQGGWDGLDGAGAELAAAQQTVADAERAEIRRQARIFADTFETPAGQRCLQLLREKSYQRPATAEELDPSSLHAFALRQARRQGMAQIVQIIETALAVARGETETGEPHA